MDKIDVILIQIINQISFVKPSKQIISLADIFGAPFALTLFNIYILRRGHFTEHSYPKVMVKTNTINLLKRFYTKIRPSLGNKYTTLTKKVREKSRGCHSHKPQPFPDPKRKRKQTNPNKHKSNKRTKSTKISSLFPKRGNRNTKRIKNTRTK